MTVSQQNSNIDLLPTSALVLYYAGIKCFDHDSQKPLVSLNQYNEMLQEVVAEQYAIFSADGSPWRDLSAEVVLMFRNRIKERKFHFMTLIEGELKSNPDVKQVVLVANGFNPMAVALAEKYPDVDFFVTDKSEQACVWNRQAYETLNLKNLTVVQSDCTDESLIGALKERSILHHPTGLEFNAAKETVFVIEGLTYYLEKKHEEALLKDCLMMSGVKNVVLMDFQDEEYLKNAADFEKMGRDEPKLHNILLDTIAKVTGCKPLRRTSIEKIQQHLLTAFIPTYTPDLQYFYQDKQYKLSNLDHLYQFNPRDDELRCCRIVKIVSKVID